MIQNVEGGQRFRLKADQREVSGNGQSKRWASQAERPSLAKALSQRRAFSALGTEER